MDNQVRANYDSPWKEALNFYFPQFLEFCFPDIYQDIDWEQGYETWDTELQEIVRDAEIGDRLADKLVKVYLRQQQQEVFLLVHVEVQGSVDLDFPKRMFIYNHRIFDRYDRQVISLAVLGDEQKSWSPNSYGYQIRGFTSYLEFPMVKLLDYQEQGNLLEESTNPFAIIIMAHLTAKKTTNHPEERFQGKLRMVRRLYERGYNREQILELFRLIDWMMVLPPGLEQEFRVEYKRYQEEQKMPYITSIERLAKEEGKAEERLVTTRQHIIAILTMRFGQVSESLTATINKIEDLAQLEQLLLRSVTILSLADFEQEISPNV